MILEEGDMWSVWGKTDLWLFTGNAHLDWNGALTMGAGIALEVTERWPRLPAILGAYLVQGNQCPYGVCVPVYVPGIDGTGKIGVFQSKDHWKGNSSLALIGYSVIALQKYIGSFKPKRVDMNCPGIGLGRLPREQVLPIISELPDAVHVWERG